MPLPFEVPHFLSPRLWLLALALPFILLFGRDIAKALSPERSLRRALAPGIGFSLWLLLIHLIGRLSGSFVTGLLSSTLGITAAFFAFLAYRIARPAPPRAPIRLFGKGLPWWGFLFILILTAPVAWMAFKWAFHDEYLYVGHMSIASGILNDTYPPRHTSFPQFELRYHYGFDLLTACISAIFPIPVDTAIDCGAVLLWFYSAVLLWTLGNAWFGRGRGYIPMVMTLFVGGTPFCLTGKPLGSHAAISICHIGNNWVMPPFISVFFQHPWSLGFPLALCALLLVSARERQHPILRLFVLGILLTTLSLGHAVLFVTFAPTLIATELWLLRNQGPKRSRAWIFVLITGAASVFIAMRMGGFFAPLPSAELGSGFYFKPGIVNGFGNMILWFAQSFGLAAPMGMIGVFMLPRRARLAMLLLMGGSLLTLFTIRYKPYPFDMVKFATVALLAMGLSGAQVVVKALHALRGAGWPRRILRALVTVVLAGSTTYAGFSFALFIPAYPKQALKYFNPSCRGMSENDIAASTYIRKHIRAGEIVYRREPMSFRYAQWAGLPSPWTDWATAGFAPGSTIDARHKLLKALPPDSKAYLAQNIVWFALDAEDKKLLAQVRKWVSAGRARHMATFGALEVFKLAEASDSAPAQSAR